MTVSCCSLILCKTASKNDSKCYIHKKYFKNFAPRFSANITKIMSRRVHCNCSASLICCTSVTNSELYSALESVINSSYSIISATLQPLKARQNRSESAQFLYQSVNQDQCYFFQFLLYSEIDLLSHSL